MALYTFIADYKGGTYISQVTAPDPKSAILAWAQNLQVEAIPGLAEKSRKNLSEALQQGEKDGVGYVPLNGLINAWCVSALVGSELMLVNFVETNTGLRR